MALSRTKESQILDLILAGHSQRFIAAKVEVCLATVNHRVQLFKEIGSTKLTSSKRKSRYPPIEETIRQRIRYYLAVETKRNRFTVEQVHEKLIDDGFSITKSKTKEWLRQERNRLKESYLDIFHEPGQMVQFDWGTKKIKINGKNRTVCFGVFAFPYSNYRYVYVTEKMDGRSFVKAFIDFTKHIGGVHPILLIDNMKIAARHKKYCDQQTQLTSLFQKLEQHYNIEVRLCTPYRPNQKGTVENAVKTLKTHLFAYQADFASLNELQEEIHKVFNHLNAKKHHEKNDTIINLLKHENRYKFPVPKKHMAFFQEEIKSVRNNSLVAFDGNYYSAPEEYKGEKIIVRYTDRTIRLVTLDGNQVLAKYTRCYGKNQKKYRVWNILNKLQHKSDGFDQSREKRQLPKWLKHLYEKGFNNKVDEFFFFLELIQNLKKNTVKRMLNWHHAFKKTLTVDSALEFVSRY
ncbi:IS21 family transposase [Bacillus sp. ISL-41]|uniref:IS21 family transposase n=1 Tax=Bacillus sp. ISL-41 TaxID=2819127 RepID=UPI001BEAA3FA|nr:IS21 family transposase [Bacillus sp. ISL-41]MBT2641742.1 IS21 family transposase [Bacillus sp. ISL-41]